MTLMVKQQKQEKASLFMQPVKDAIPDREKAIEALLNDYHQARKDQDVERRAFLRALIHEELDLFDKEETDREPARACWICPVMRAAACMAFGEYEDAVVWDLQSLEHARSPLDRAKSLINTADALKMAGRADEAVPFATEAFAIRPEADWVIVNLAQVLYHAGLPDEANQIIGKLGETSDLSDSTNVLAAYLRFEDDLREMRDLPEVAALLSQLD